MSDIELRVDREGQADLAMDGVDLATDAGLQTAVVVSLFTDARADTDEIPEGHTSPRGWWGEFVEDGGGFGSKLWTLAREKTLNAVVVRAEEYAREALEWMIEDGVATEVDVRAGLVDRDTITLEIRIARGDSDDIAVRYAYNWREQVQAGEAA